MFDGLGDEADRARRVRYDERSLTLLERGGLSLGGPGRNLKLGGTTLLERSKFAEIRDDSQPQATNDSAHPLDQLPGFARGFTTLELQGNLIVDTRNSPAGTCRGVYAMAFAGGVPRLTGYELGHAGLDVSAYVDLYKTTRVLVLRAAVEGVFGKHRDIPFTRLPRLGGPERLRGYVPGAFRDRESALLSAEYRYPIHRIVAGALFVDSGSVAPDPSGLVSLSRWHVGGGVGLRVRTTATTIATLDLAFGSGAQLLLSVFPLDAPAPGARQ